MRRIVVSPVPGLGLLLVLVPLLAVGSSCGAEDPGSPAPVGGSGEAADSASLTTALAAAAPGDTVRLTGSSYQGSFVIPAGVSVEAADGATPVFVGGEGAVFITNGADRDATRLSGVRIESSSVGVVARGPGAIELTDLVLAPTTGLALAADGVTALGIRRVTVEGPVGEAELAELGESLDARATAVVGIAVAGSQVQLEEVQISGIAGFGALFHGSSGRWNGGRVFECVGTSVLIEGGELELEGLAIEDGKVGTRVGFNILANGLVIGTGGSARTIGVGIRRIPGVGVLQGAGTSQHLDLTVQGSGRAGIWVQGAGGSGDAPSLSVTGTSVIEDSMGLGVHLRSTGGALLDGLRISRTTPRPIVSGGLRVDLGDGLQTVGGSGALHLSSVRVEGSSRIGLLLDGDGGPGLSPALEDVTVDGPAEAYGILTQNGAPPRGELLGITVGAAAEANDGVAVQQGLALAISPAASGVPAAGLIDEIGLVGEAGLIDEQGRLGSLGGVGEAGLIDEQ